MLVGRSSANTPGAESTQALMVTMEKSGGPASSPDGAIATGVFPSTV